MIPLEKVISRYCKAWYGTYFSKRPFTVSATFVLKEPGVTATRPCIRIKAYPMWLSQRCAAAFFVAFGLLTCNLGAQQGAVQKLRIFAERLDSLELEKQMRKRQGKSLEDLERAADLIKDSIVGERRQISSGEENSALPAEAGDTEKSRSATSPTAVAGLQRWLPKNVFDWIVVAVGGVAIISGAVLVIGLLGLVSRRLRKKKSAAPLHEMFPRASRPPNLVDSPKVQVDSADSGEDRVELIRQRIQTSEQSSVDGPGGPAIPLDLGNTGEGTASERSADPAQIRNKVIAASLEGLDVLEISRRFHLSADQVSLILRIARHAKGKSQ